MNPFAEIEVTPLYSRDGMQSQGKSVRIRDEETPLGWNELGVVSSNYLLVHNEKVKSVVDDIATRSPIKDWDQRKLFFDGRRFVYSITTDKLVAEISPGDTIRLGLIAYNSYDGSRALSIEVYAEHLVCSNGMTSTSSFSRFTFRHNQGNINWDEQITVAFTTLLGGSRARLMRFANLLGKMKSRGMDIQLLSEVRQTALPDFSASTWGKVIDRFLLHEEQTLMGLMDACTFSFWHNEKQSYSDYKNNTYATDRLISLVS